MATVAIKNQQATLSCLTRSLKQQQQAIKSAGYLELPHTVAKHSNRLCTEHP
jgi:hypothetical protein